VRASGTERMLAYADAVEDGGVLACDALKKAVARFRRDWKAAKRKGSRWVFDTDAADKIVRNIERLVHFEDPFTGLPIVLELWQCFLVCQLYGWKSRVTGLRRFKKVLWFFARKQGKTILASALALNETTTRAGIEAYALATKQLVSNKSFKNIERFIAHNPALKRRFRIHKSPKAVECPETASVFLPLSSDSDLDGLNPSVAIIDELAAQRNGDAYAMLTSGMGTRPERLTIIISTAAASLDNPLIPEYEYAKKVLDQILEDDELLVAIYEYDKGDRWDDTSKLLKSCPNLGVTTTLEFYEGELKKARSIPRAALEYKTKYCNLWQSSDKTWIPDRTWIRCGKLAAKHERDISPQEIAEAPCTIGLDFAKIHDWTAMSAYFFIKRLDKILARHWFFIPEATVETKVALENSALRDWIERGFVTATPGEIIDYEYIYREIEAFAPEHNLKSILYDPAMASDFRMRYEDHPKITIVPFRQAPMTMGPAAKAWEKAVIEDQILDDSPIMRWMVSCTINAAKNDAWVIPSKVGAGKYAKRIDGVISSIMAHAGIVPVIHDAKKPKPRLLDLSKISY
jgi:phage terminase large subunit-like protein